jgi:hypothetical protein
MSVDTSPDQRLSFVFVPFRPESIRFAGVAQGFIFDQASDFIQGLNSAGMNRVYANGK